MDSQREEGGGRILLGVNTGGRVVILEPIKFQCVELEFQLDTLVFTCTAAVGSPEMLLNYKILRYYTVSRRRG